jgi:hypothetical protein
MAVRLAVDLGLHLDAGDYVKGGIIDQEEADLRSTVFWGAFVHDRYINPLESGNSSSTRSIELTLQ